MATEFFHYAYIVLLFKVKVIAASWYVQMYLHRPQDCIRPHVWSHGGGQQIMSYCY